MFKSKVDLEAIVVIAFAFAFAFLYLLAYCVLLYR